MTLANQPESRIPPPGRPGKRSWFSALLGKGEPELEAPVLPAPPRAGKTRVELGGAGGDKSANEGIDSRPKRSAFVADLLVMSSLDEKAPPAGAGTDAVLDALVRDHLERATARGAAPGQERTAEQDDEAGMVAGGPAALPSPDDAADNMAALHREIQALLAGEPSAQAPVERGTAGADSDAFEDFPAEAPGEEPAEPIIAGGPSVSVESNVPAGADVSRAELDVLLKDEVQAEAGEGADAVRAGAVAEPGAAGAGVAAEARAEISVAAAEALPPISSLKHEAPTQISALASSLADDVETKLSEADGVMAEELAQLVAETQAAEAPGAAVVEAGAGAGADPVHPDLAAAVQTIMNNPVQVDGQSREALVEAAPAEAAAGAVVVDEAPIAEASTVAAVAGSAAVVVEPAKASAELAEQPVERVAAGPGLIARLWHLLLDMVLMVLQVIDMPFGWIKEPEKNVLGIAAFCLLVGGAAIYGWAMWLVRH